MIPVATNESYIIASPYEQVISRARRALSRHDLQILRERDIGSRLGKDSGREIKNCRVFYVIQPDLLALAISTDPTAALWLPVPLLLVDETVQTQIFLPVEAIVCDRASLLGIRDLVHNLYASLNAALETIRGTTARLPVRLQEPRQSSSEIAQ